MAAKLQVAASTEFKIEKGIAPPVAGVSGRRKYPWQEMDINDSFVWPHAHQAAYGAARDANKEEILKASPKRFKASKRDGVMRCWRIA